MASRLADPPAPPSRRSPRPETAAASATAGLLPVSLLATAALLVLPGATVAVATAVSGTALSGVAVWLVTGIAALGYMLAGSKLWARHPRSAGLSFGELVLWSWARRRRAEGTLERGAELLDEEVAELLNPQGRREQVKVLRELNAALEVRDPYTRGHARRVERHAHRIALALRCSDDDIFDIRLAASLHDVGKIKVPDRVLRKDGPLDEAEWAIMQQHSEVGAELLQRLGNQNVVAAVRSHHERWDGLGYPVGLLGTSIPLGARIIAVADTFDAITSCRPYRNRSDRAHAIAVLKAEAGRQFDPAVVSAFLSTTPHTAAAFAGIATLAAPLARKAASQWGVLFNKVGAVSLAGTMTASAFTGAAVEGPLKERLARPEKPAAVTAEEPSAEDGAPDEKRGHSPTPPGKALGHSKKAHEGGNGKSHAGGNGKSHAGGNGKPQAGEKGKALGHSKKAGIPDAPGNGNSKAASKTPQGKPAHKPAPQKPAQDDPGDAAPAPEPQPEAPAKPEPQPKPKEEPPAESAPAPAEPEEPAPAAAEPKGNGKAK
ncbi:MAG TPA: HD domain-containing phosphohydrolase [Actinomycetota bacterium]|nr:HD domain-containing phosphohydrolase [Actinomycetota bacterium]